jgi:hypothetical protein
MEPNYALSIIPGVICGLAMKRLTVQMQTGIIEMIIMVSVYLFVANKMVGSLQKASAILILGYGFAWVGHFFYEKNRPATFTYPVYSLIADFRMWYQMLRTTGSIG